MDSTIPLNLFWNTIIYFKYFHEEFCSLKEQYYLLIFPDTTNYYSKIGFIDLFDVGMLIAHVIMPCVFFTDKSQSALVSLTITSENLK